MERTLSHREIRELAPTVDIVNGVDRIEAIINSMTVEERMKPQIIDGSRRKRVARGSGTSVQAVNRLLKQFQDMKKMMKQMGKMQKRMKMPFSFG